MALTRQRIITIAPTAQPAFQQTLQRILTADHSARPFREDILELRERIWQEYPVQNSWKVKHSKGGLLDIGFAAQFIALTHCHKYPQLLTSNPIDMLKLASDCGIISYEDYQSCADSYAMQNKIQTILRLCDRNFDETRAPKALEPILCNATGCANLAEAKAYLQQLQANSYGFFTKIIGQYPTA